MSQPEGAERNGTPEPESGGFLEEGSPDGRRGRRLSPASWVAIGLGAVLILVVLGVVVTRQYSSPAVGGVGAAKASGTDSGTSAQGGVLGQTGASAPVQSVTDPSGATVYRQADPAAIAAQGNPALATATTARGGARGPTQSDSSSRSTAPTQAPSVAGGAVVTRAAPWNGPTTNNAGPNAAPPRGALTPLIGANAPGAGTAAAPGAVPAPPRPAPGRAPP